MLKVGDVAPEFSTDAVVGDQSTPVKLSDYHGRKVVLYFYPKDNTPGCTKEACTFRDGYNDLQRWGIVLLGCSIDSADSHRAFARKYSLPFPLLLDPDNKIAKAYGADNGIPILGLDRRVTYVIGEDGHILKVYPKRRSGQPREADRAATSAPTSRRRRRSPHAVAHARRDAHDQAEAAQGRRFRFGQRTRLGDQPRIASPGG